MSTLAVWMFVGLGVLLVLMIGAVIMAGLVTARKGKALAREVSGLQRDVDEAVGSAGERRSQDQ